MFDGRILLPTTDPATPGADVPPRFTRTPPKEPQAIQLDGGNVLLRAPDGFEIRISPAGEAKQILWHGQAIMTGGWPGIFAPGMRRFDVRKHEPAAITVNDGVASVEFQGTLEHEGKRIDYTETCSISADKGWRTRFQFTIRNDLDLRMWRQYVSFPVAMYAGGTAQAGTTTVALPKVLGEAKILPAANRVVLTARGLEVTVESTCPMGLVDHRKWHTQEFLLAGYPLNGQVKAGTTLTVERRISVKPLGAKPEGE
jgi:hypothetical protein